ncbi:MAG: hypothetical protein K8R48_02465 [Alphaproteobacteria bacterium]|nr:hypothetical protein [Alphaproteobacteria bacterium]
MTAQPKKYYIRFSKVEDHDKIMEFFAANPHKNVADRHSDLIKTLADNGSVILIEDAQTGTFVGVSISYPLFAKNGAVEQEKWLEIGTTRIVLNGYPGLFDAMVALQVMRAYLVEPPEDRFVCQMESPLVRKMADKLGFRPYTPSQELVDISDKTLDIDAGSSYGFDNWYSAGPEALPVLAKYLKEVLDKPCLEHLKTGEKIELDFSKSNLFKVFEDEIRSLAGRNLGDPDKPDPTKSLAKNRQEWLRGFFR